jgi:hypothetical protein
MIMKKIYTLSLAAIALLMSLSSCNRKDVFVGDFCFVTFDNSTAYAVREDTPSIELPVRVIKNTQKKAFSVTVAGIDGTAKNGINYRIVEPENGVLNFTGEDLVKNIVVEPIKVDGYVEPGFVNFSIRLETATNGVALGGLDEATITLNDADHPLASIIGAYAATGANGAAWTLNLSTDEKDVTLVWIDAIMPYWVGKSYPIKGIVSDDLKTITIPNAQVNKYSGYDIGCYKFDGQYFYSATDGSADMVYTATEDGFACEYGAFTGLSSGSTFSANNFNPGPIKWTKK